MSKKKNWSPIPVIVSWLNEPVAGKPFCIALSTAPQSAHTISLRNTKIAVIFPILWSVSTTNEHSSRTQVIWTFSTCIVQPKPTKQNKRATRCANTKMSHICVSYDRRLASFVFVATRFAISKLLFARSLSEILYSLPTMLYDHKMFVEAKSFADRIPARASL